MSYNNIICIFIDIKCDTVKSELITTLPAARMTSDAPVDAALVDELDALRAVYGDDDAFESKEDFGDDDDPEEVEEEDAWKRRRKER